MTEQLRLLEARVLTGISTAEQWQSLERELRAEDFDYYAPLYGYIRESISAHNLVPRLRDLNETFNLPKGLVRKAERWHSDFEEMTNLILIRRIQETTNRVVSELSDRPKDMLAAIVRELGELATPSSSHMSMTDSSAESRVAYYESLEAERLARGTDYIGIPTGIRFFDREHRIGWMRGELIGLLARTYMGKTWFLIDFAVRAWQTGERVLFISPELSRDEAEARIDVILAGRAGVPIDLSDLYRGFTPSKEFRSVLQHAAKRKDWYTYTSGDRGAFTVGDVARLIRKHEPSIVAIDGLMLLRLEEPKRAIWEQVSDLCKGLKNLAMAREVPILVAHQANRSASNPYKPPLLHEVSGGDAFVQDCDRVIALCKVRPDPERLEVDYASLLRLTIQKFRRGAPEGGGYTYNFQPSKGVIHEYCLRCQRQFSRCDTEGHRTAEPASDYIPADLRRERSSTPLSIP